MNVSELRVVVHGASGSGKTTFARALAATARLAHLELDSVFHQPNWTGLDDQEFSRRVSRFIADDQWVVDGNYRIVRSAIWRRATLIVIIDRPRWQTTWRVLRRTVIRGVTRQNLWNDNRESLWRLFSPTPERNIVLWSILKQPQYRADVQDEARQGAPGVPVMTIHNDEEARRLITYLTSAEVRSAFIRVDDYVRTRSRSSRRRRR